MADNRKSSGPKTKNDVQQTLIKSLVSNGRFRQKSVRDKAVKLLQKWLQGKTEISEQEFLRICSNTRICLDPIGMWHSDKVPIQQELAQRLAKFVHFLPSIASAILFQRTFYLTMQREWLIIDRLRLDKYYSLIRQVVFEGLAYLKEMSWEIEIVQELANMFLAPDGPFLKPDSPTGVANHVAEVFGDELLKVGPEKMPALTLNVLLEPFVQLLGTSTNPILVHRIRDSIFNKLLEAHRSEEGKLPNFDTKHFSVQFFKLASSPATVGKSRKLLYQMTREFDARPDGAATNGREVTHTQPGAAAAEPTKLTQAQHKKHKKAHETAEQQKKAKHTEETLEQDDIEQVQEEQEPIQEKDSKKKKHKKPKHEVIKGDQVVDAVVEQLAAEQQQQREEDAQVAEEAPVAKSKQPKQRGAPQTPPAAAPLKQKRPKQGDGTPKTNITPATSQNVALSEQNTKKPTGRPPTPYKKLHLDVGDDDDDGRLVASPLNISIVASSKRDLKSPKGAPTTSPTDSGANAKQAMRAKVTQKRKSVQFAGADVAEFPKNSSPTVIVKRTPQSQLAPLSE